MRKALLAAALFPSFALAVGFFHLGVKAETSGIVTTCFATSQVPEAVIPEMYSARHQPPAANLPPRPPGANPYDYAGGPTFTQQQVLEASGGEDMLGKIQDFLGRPNWQRNATPYVTFFNRGDFSDTAPPEYIAVFPMSPCRPANLDDTMHYWSEPLGAPIQSKGPVPTAQEIYQAGLSGSWVRPTPLEQPWTWQNPSFMDRVNFYYHVLADR